MKLDDGEWVVADENDFSESILHGVEQVVSGYPSAMGPFEEQRENRRTVLVYDHRLQAGLTALPRLDHVLLGSPCVCGRNALCRAAVPKRLLLQSSSTLNKRVRSLIGVVSSISRTCFLPRNVVQCGESRNAFTNLRILSSASTCRFESGSGHFDRTHYAKFYSTPTLHHPRRLPGHSRSRHRLHEAHPSRMPRFRSVHARL